MDTSTRQWIGRANEQVRQFLCGLHGHDALLHFERGRLSLLCSSCGHESPGWDLKAAHLRADAATSATRVNRRWPVSPRADARGLA